MTSRYDTIGINYNQTRKADPYLAERFAELLDPKPEGLYLDIGCGTGNYTNALQKRGFNFIGIDPSEEMLNKARPANTAIDWQLGTAENTGLDDQSIHGVMAGLTLHHWEDLRKGFFELHRILKGGGKIVIFTSTPQQMEGYWLNHYFPRMLEASTAQMPSFEAISTAMTEAGFIVSGTEKYFVRPDLEDLFLASGKHNPEIYFKPEVRSGISSFAALANREEVARGLDQLREDVSSGKVKSVIASCENDKGDYLFVTGRKGD